MVTQPDPTVSSESWENIKPHPVSLHKHEMRVAKLACININGITARTVVEMLMEFIRQHDLDILLYRG